MAAATLIHGDISSAQHQSLLSQFSDRFLFAWVEGHMEAKLAYYRQLSDSHDIQRWPTGRIFWEKGEYRWKRLGEDSIHGVLLLEQESLPHPNPFNSSLTVASYSDSALILWGAWLDHESMPNLAENPRFYAAEIPQTQTYPIPLDGVNLTDAGKKTPRLIIRRYCHPERGEFLRCVTLDLQGDEEDG